MKTLGVPLFYVDAAPLTDKLIEEEVPLWLSSVLHKAAIDVDEEGTTAAAVTVADEDSLAATPPLDESIEMICDKPFVFVLYDYIDGGGKKVLFTGIVYQP